MSSVLPRAVFTLPPRPPTPAIPADRPHQDAQARGVPTVPVIPPDAVLAPYTTIRPQDRGKAVGQATRRGPATGAYVWVGGSITGLLATPAPVAWDRWGASVGVPGQAILGLDLDIPDANQTEAVLAWLVEWLTDHNAMPVDGLPIRFGRWPRALVPVSVPGGYPSRDIRVQTPPGQPTMGVQFIGQGKQWVAAGTHPGTGQPYWWTTWDHRSGSASWPSTGMYSVTRAPVLTPDQVDELYTELASALSGMGLSVRTTGHAPGQVGSPGATDPAVLAAPSIPALAALMRDVPSCSTPGLDGSRDEWVRVGQAIKGATIADPDAGREIFTDWSSRWHDPTTGEIWPQDNDPDQTWATLAVSHTLGWGWLADQIRTCVPGIEPEHYVWQATGRVGSPLADPAIQASVQAQAQAVAPVAQAGTSGGLFPSSAPAAQASTPATPAGALAARLTMLRPRPYLLGEPIGMGSASGGASNGAYEAGTVTILAGRGGASKTMLLLMDCVLAVSDLPLLGPARSALLPGMRALHINGDESDDDMARRLAGLVLVHEKSTPGFGWSSFGTGLTIVSRSHPAVHNRELALTQSGPGGRIEVRPAGIARLRALIYETGANLVQLDPASAFIEGLNEGDVMYPLLMALSTIAEGMPWECAIVLSHHTRKGPPGGGFGAAGNEDPADQIKGSRALVDSPRHVDLLMPMPVEAAMELGVPETEAWRARVVAPVKSNHAVLDDGFRFWIESVSLGNAWGRRRADHVGVPVVFDPGRFAVALTPARVVATLGQIAQLHAANGGLFSCSPGVARGAAALTGVQSVAEVVAVGLGVPEGRAQAIVGQWMREGVLGLASVPNPAGASSRTRQGVRVQPDPSEWPGIAQRLCGG